MNINYKWTSLPLAMLLSIVLGCGSDSKKSTNPNVTTVEGDAASLSLETVTFSSGDSSTAITGNFTLPLTGTGGSTISWESDNTDAISISEATATVTRVDEDSDVILTATLTFEDASTTKDFEVTVKARNALSLVGKYSESTDPFTNTSAIWKAAYWTDGEKTDLTADITASRIGTLIVVTSGSDVYISTGLKDSTTGITTAGYWKNGTWNSLDPLVDGQDCNPFSLSISGTDVYVGGICNQTNTAPYNQKSGYWLNGSWTSITIPSQFTSCNLGSISILGSDIYIPATCDSTNAGYLKNGTFNALTYPSGYSAGNTSLVTAVGDDIHVIGLANNGSNNFPIYWKNGTSTLLDVSSVTGATGGSAYNSLLIVGDDIYVRGNIFKTGGYTEGYWKNENRVNIEDYTITSMVNLDSEVFIFGKDSDKNPVYLDSEETVTEIEVEGTGTEISAAFR